MIHAQNRRHFGTTAAALGLTAVLPAWLSRANAQTVEDIKKKGELTVGLLVDFPPYGTLNSSNQPDGYDASWSVDTAMAYDRTFNLSYFAGGVSYGVSLADSTGLRRQRAKRPWFSAVERVRASMRSQHTMPRR